MRTKHKQSGTTSTSSAMLTGILHSMQNRPMAWLMSVWAVGWAIFAWHFIHPASWDAAWGALNRAVSPARHINGASEPAAVRWLREIGKWGQVSLYSSSTVLALYVCYALWVWRQYKHVWMPRVRMERLHGGQVLEVIIPTGSKADARAAADMFGQIGKLLGDRARAGGSRGSGRIGRPGNSKPLIPNRSRLQPDNLEAERLALSLEMWNTPYSGGKVGFYIWCPTSKTALDKTLKWVRTMPQRQRRP